MGILNRNREKEYRLHRRFMALHDVPRRHRPRRCKSRIQKTWYGRDAAFHRWLRAKKAEEAAAGIEVPKVVRIILV